MLEDISYAIDHILAYTKELSYQQYSEDQKTKDAVERNSMIIGEAASRVPDSFRQEYSHIEWRIIKDFRNFIIHEYFGINDLIVWDTIILQLPEFKRRIHELRRKLSGEEGR